MGEKVGDRGCFHIESARKKEELNPLTWMSTGVHCTHWKEARKKERLKTVKD